MAVLGLSLICFGSATSSINDALAICLMGLLAFLIDLVAFLKDLAAFLMVACSFHRFGCFSHGFGFKRFLRKNGKHGN